MLLPAHAAPLMSGPAVDGGSQRLPCAYRTDPEPPGTTAPFLPVLRRSSLEEKPCSGGSAHGASSHPDALRPHCPPKLFKVFKTVSAILGPSHFRIHSRTSLSISTKTPCLDFSWKHTESAIWVRTDTVKLPLHKCASDVHSLGFQQDPTAFCPGYLLLIST